MTTELTYRRTSIAGASPLGLMIALLDTLVGDFRRAADALHKNDIETRCREMNHAALVLGQLESWVDLKNGGESAQTLARFYAYLRAKMMEAAVNKSASILETQIESVLHVRTAWQQLDATPPPAPEEPANEASGQTGAVYARATDIMADRIPFSQSA
jgi:flagellar protein FliS